MGLFHLRLCWNVSAMLLYVPEFPVPFECWIILYDVHILHFSRCVQSAGHGQPASKASCESMRLVCVCVRLDCAGFKHELCRWQPCVAMSQVGHTWIHDLLADMNFSCWLFGMMLLQACRHNCQFETLFLTLLDISRSHGDFMLGIFFYVCARVGTRVPWHTRGGQKTALSSLLPLCGIWKSYLCYRTHVQAALPDEPSCRPMFKIAIIIILFP